MQPFASKIKPDHPEGGRAGPHGDCGLRGWNGRIRYEPASNPSRLALRPRHLSVPVVPGPVVREPLSYRGG